MKSASHRVILVEDEVSAAEALEFALDKCGIEVIRASGMKDILKHQALTPHAILMDLIIMGELKGFTFLEQLHSHPTLRNVPSMVLTDYGTSVDEARARSFGAKDFMIKSDSSISEVIDRVTKMIGDLPVTKSPR